MKKFITIILLCFLAVSNGYAGADKVGWVVFKKLNSPEVASLALTGDIKGDLTPLKKNPALLADMEGPRLSFFRENGAAEDGLLGFMGSYNLFSGSLYGGIYLYSGGRMDLNYISSENMMVTREVVAQEDTVFNIAYGQPITEKLSAGLGFSFGQSVIAEREDAKATAMAADAGLIYNIKDKARAVLLLNDFGKTTAYVNKKEKLSNGIYLGGSYGFSIGQVEVKPAAGINYLSVEERTLYDAGIECRYGIIRAQTGYNINADDMKLNFGMGLLYKDFDFKFSYIPASYLNSSFRITLGYIF